MEKMSRQLPLNPTFIPPPYGVLRSLLENPLKLPLHPEDGERCLGSWAQGRDDTPRDTPHPKSAGRAPASFFLSPRFSEMGGGGSLPLSPQCKGDPFGATFGIALGTWLAGLSRFVLLQRR